MKSIHSSKFYHAIVFGLHVGAFDQNTESSAIYCIMVVDATNQETNQIFLCVVETLSKFLLWNSTIQLFAKSNR